ncbi:MAG: DoxX family protein [Acidiferrobacter sp.]
MSDNKKSLAVFELIGRIFLASIFLFAAIGKIMNYHGTAAYMAAYGVPSGLLPVVIAVELLGSFGLIFGLFTRYAAAMLAIFSLTAIIIFHHTFPSPMDKIVTLAEIAFTGGLITVAVHGAGCLSLDNRRRH